MLARAEERARRFRRDLKEVIQELAEARAVVTTAPRVCLCGGHDSEPESCPMAAADCRQIQLCRGLPEAAAVQGYAALMLDAELRGSAFVRKIVLRFGRQEQILAFMEEWAPSQGLTDIHVDHARGIAGGYPTA
jgi:hypothetical protein